MFFWGVVKEKVCKRTSHRVAELKDFISQAFTDIDSNRNLCVSVRTCSGTCSRNVAILMEDISST